MITAARFTPVGNFTSPNLHRRSHTNDLLYQPFNRPIQPMSFENGNSSWTIRVVVSTWHPLYTMDMTVCPQSKVLSFSHNNSHASVLMQTSTNIHLHLIYTGINLHESIPSIWTLSQRPTTHDQKMHLTLPWISVSFSAHNSVPLWTIKVA